MKPINLVSLIIWFVLSLVGGFLYSSWAVANGYHVPVSALSLSVSVLVVAMVLLVLALPIYKYKRSLKKALEAKDNKNQRVLPVDPFYAVRVLLLAKASAITAALFVGWHLGVIGYLLNAPVLAYDALGPNVTASVVSVILLVAAFVVQSICRLPNNSGPTDNKAAA